MERGDENAPRGHIPGLLWIEQDGKKVRGIHTETRYTSKGVRRVFVVNDYPTDRFDNLPEIVVFGVSGISRAKAAL